MSRLIQRAALTGALLGVLRDSGRQVGDAEKPRGGTAGWVGQPNADGTNFVPYSVLTPLAAGGGDGSLTAPGENDWLPYAITSYGVSREQCEDQADLLRLQCLTINKLTVVQWAGTPFEYGRRIQTVVVQSYGAVQRMGDTDPKYYGQTDTLSLWTTV